MSRAFVSDSGNRAMPVTQDGPAPYAPPKAILDLVLRHRNKGLPSPVDADVLARSGIPDSLIPRTLQSLKILDLLNDDGSISEALERIRLATEAEYQPRLAEWLNAAYADALAYIDPATADEVDIRDAFRKYNPTGQQTRMVTLFMGLFTAAGVMPDRERPAKKVVARRLLPRPAPANRERKQASGPFKAELPLYTPQGGIPPALAGLLADLPANGAGWTKEKRDAFKATFSVVLDYCIPIVAASSQTEAAADQ